MKLMSNILVVPYNVVFLSGKIVAIFGFLILINGFLSEEGVTSDENIDETDCKNEKCPDDSKQTCRCSGAERKKIIKDFEKEEDDDDGPKFKVEANDMKYQSTLFEKDSYNWKEVSGDFPENELVELQGGSFIMGTDDSPIPEDGESPARTVILSPFAIDKYEVSVGEFREFVLATDFITEVIKNYFFFSSRKIND